MAFCTNCGNKIVDGARYCPVCGEELTPTIIGVPLNQGISQGANQRISQGISQGVSQNTSQNINYSQRQIVYDGTVKKCPNCGEILNSFVSKCPACGIELRDTRNSMSVKEFERRYSASYTNEGKIDLIRTFIIPNTKEDILEFVILASTNINQDSYYNNYGTSDSSVSRELTAAWIAKLEQAYQKAQIVMKNDPDLFTVQRIYDQKKQSLTGAKYEAQLERQEERREERREARRMLFRTDSSSRKTIIAIAAFLVLIIVGFGSLEIPHRNKERKLEKQVAVIEDLIEKGDYDTALLKAEQLIIDDNWSEKNTEKWEQIRESLIRRIKEAQGSATIPSDDCVGKNYEDVVLIFKEAGFINIETEKVPDLVTGWINKDGEVIEVLVNGSTDYEPGSYISKDAKVLIRYHGYKDK